MVHIKGSYHTCDLAQPGDIVVVPNQRKSDFSDPSEILMIGFDALDRRHSIMFPQRNAVNVIVGMLNAIGDIGEQPEDTLHLDSTTRLELQSFAQHQMGRGLVAYKQSDTQRANGQYDPHPLLVHRYAENEDPRIQEQVAAECALLARLLNNFRFANDSITDSVKECGVK